MKDFVLLLLYIVAIACVAGVVGSLLNYFLGWHISFKGAEVPGDLRATAMFVILGGVCASVLYFADRKRA